jgi:hypothetical protein
MRAPARRYGVADSPTRTYRLIAIKFPGAVMEKEQKIDKSRIKDPAEVSGWGFTRSGKSPQNFSDIARRSQLNTEFTPEVGRTTTQGRCDGSAHAK